MLALWKINAKIVSLDDLKLNSCCSIRGLFGVRRRIHGVPKTFHSGVLRNDALRGPESRLYDQAMFLSVLNCPES